MVFATFADCGHIQKAFPNIPDCIQERLENDDFYGDSVLQKSASADVSRAFYLSVPPRGARRNFAVCLTNLCTTHAHVQCECECESIHPDHRVGAKGRRNRVGTENARPDFGPFQKYPRVARRACHPALVVRTRRYFCSKSTASTHDKRA